MQPRDATRRANLEYKLKVGLTTPISSNEVLSFEFQIFYLESLLTVHTSPAFARWVSTSWEAFFLSYFVLDIMLGANKEL